MGLSTVSAEEADNQSPEHSATTNMMGAVDLWAGMLEAGMIDEEQFRHVQETGHLPGGSVVTNSPITADSQANWNLLAKQELISPDELASMIFGGDIPGLTEEEERAFVELAPVYQPKRTRRLTYEVRRKHARVELIRLGHRLSKEREAFEERASLLNIQLKLGAGALIHIDEEGRPHYSGALGIGSCDSISTDEVWGTNRVNAAGDTNTNFNLTGAGITLAMWEYNGVVNETHPEFAGRVTNAVGNSDFHANAVAAVMIGAGVTNNAHGTAHAAILHAYVWDGDLFSLEEVANENVIRFSNHSYKTYLTNYGYGGYTPNDERRDELVYTAYYHLPICTVGNEGLDMYGYIRDNRYSTLACGNAKNVLGVGAVKELIGGYTGASNVLMTTYSSWGPTVDGRIKPDLVASGFSGWIPVESGTTYNEVGDHGTSYAAPAVTGSLGLLQELHERLYGTNAPLFASTYKGLAIHTADEAGDAPGPDYQFGWGLMNTHSAAQLMANNAEWNSKPFIKELMLPDGEYSSFPVEADTNLPLRVTLCWSDPPGSALINDIDLRIIDPFGQTNFPWVLDPTAGHRADPAEKDDNTVDNVEQVEITNTSAGAYTVLINHKGSLVNADDEVDGQEVSIILSGLLPENIDPDHYVFSFSSNGIPCVEIPDIIGSVYVISQTVNLVYSPWDPVPESPLSVLHWQTEWIDSDGSTNPIRFYKIEQTR